MAHKAISSLILTALLFQFGSAIRYSASNATKSNISSHQLVVAHNATNATKHHQSLVSHKFLNATKRNTTRQHVPLTHKPVASKAKAVKSKASKHVPSAHQLVAHKSANATKMTKMKAKGSARSVKKVTKATKGSQHHGHVNASQKAVHNNAKHKNSTNETVVPELKKKHDPHSKDWMHDDGAPHAEVEKKTQEQDDFPNPDFGAGPAEEAKEGESKEEVKAKKADAEAKVEETKFLAQEKAEHDKQMEQARREEERDEARERKHKAEEDDGLASDGSGI